MVVTGSIESQLGYIDRSRGIPAIDTINRVVVGYGRKLNIVDGKLEVGERDFVVCHGELGKDTTIVKQGISLDVSETQLWACGEGNLLLGENDSPGQIIFGNFACRVCNRYLLKEDDSEVFVLCFPKQASVNGRGPKVIVAKPDGNPFLVHLADIDVGPQIVNLEGYGPNKALAVGTHYGENGQFLITGFKMREGKPADVEIVVEGARQRETLPIQDFADHVLGSEEISSCDFGQNWRIEITDQVNTKREFEENNRKLLEVPTGSYLLSFDRNGRHTVCVLPLQIDVDDKKRWNMLKNMRKVSGPSVLSYPDRKIKITRDYEYDSSKALVLGFRHADKGSDIPYAIVKTPYTPYAHAIKASELGREIRTSPSAIRIGVDGIPKDKNFLEIRVGENYVFEGERCVVSGFFYNEEKNKPSFF